MGYLVTDSQLSVTPRGPEPLRNLETSFSLSSGFCYSTGCVQTRSKPVVPVPLEQCFCQQSVPLFEITREEQP